MPRMEELLALAQKGMQTPQGQQMMQQAMKTMGPQVIQQVAGMMSGGGEMQAPRVQGMAGAGQAPAMIPPPGQGGLTTENYMDTGQAPMSDEAMQYGSGPSPDQAMLDMIASSMGGGKQMSGGREKPTPNLSNEDVEGQNEYEWEGSPDGVPSKKDLQFLQDNMTDGVINDFTKQFPTWADQNNLAEGGVGLTDSGEDDDYAMDEKEKRDLYQDRSTEIDER